MIQYRRRKEHPKDRATAHKEDSMKEFELITEAAKEAYIEIMGEAKWNSLTDQQKHDVTMIMVKDMLKAM